MLDLSSQTTDARVLEPSCGEGVFLDALAERGFQNVTGIELDAQLPDHPTFPIIRGSFLGVSFDTPFDLIIGNPPYIRWKDLGDEAKKEITHHPLYGSLLNALTDYLAAFIIQSVQLLRDRGELIFVTPSFWMHTQHSEPLRNWLLQKGSVTDIIDFGESRVFPGVNSSIIIFKFVKSLQITTARLHRFIGRRNELPHTMPISTDDKLFQSVNIESFKTGQHWSLFSSDELIASDRLERVCYRSASTLFENHDAFRIGDIADIANGMVSGLDRAFQLPPDLLEHLNQQEVEALISVVKARQLDAFFSTGVTSYVDLPQGLTEEEIRDTFPNLLSHLETYRSELEKRYDYGRNLPYWEWAFRRSETFFLSTRRKIFVPCKERMTNKPTVRFSLAPVNAVAVQDVTALALKSDVKESIEYVLAYLNHPLVSEWVRKRGLMKGGIAEFSERPLASIPFRPISWSDAFEVRKHDEITQLVGEMEMCERRSLTMKVLDLVSELLEAAPTTPEPA